MANPLWTTGLLRTFFPGRFFLARLTRVPILRNLMDQWLFRGDRMFLLPQTAAIHVNETIDPPQEVLLPHSIVDGFIESSEYRWIMNACICRESSGCKDYPVSLGCLFMGEAVLGIDPRLGRLATKEEAFEHVRLCRDAGLVHLIGRNRLDPLWLGISPPDRLLTVCNCCPCCCLWRMLPDLHLSISGRFTKLEGVTVRVTDGCSGCGACTQDVCFVNAIRMDGPTAVITHACRGCGRCVDKCPRKAIRLTIERSENLDNPVRLINQLVNVR